MTEHVFDTHDEHTPHLHDDAMPADASREPRSLDPKAPRPRSQRKRNANQTNANPSQASQPVTPRDPQAELAELETQGFTPDEAARLLYISDRLAHSQEAREAEAVMRRLRFHRWLVESGRLTEFSA